MGESEFDGFVDHEDDCRLDIFQMTTNNNEPSWWLELLNFRRIHVDVKDIKSPLLRWEKHHF